MDDVIATTGITYIQKCTLAYVGAQPKLIRLDDADVIEPGKT